MNVVSADYPKLNFIWVLVGTGLACVVAVWPIVESRAIDRKEYLRLFGASGTSQFAIDLILFALVAFVPISIILATLPAMACGKIKRLRVGWQALISGSAVSIGWFFTLPYLILWMLFGFNALNAAKLNYEKKSREYFLKSMGHHPMYQDLNDIK